MYRDKLIYRKKFTSLRNQGPYEDSLLNVDGTNFSEFEAKIAMALTVVSGTCAELIYIFKLNNRSHCHDPLNEKKIVADYLCNFLEKLGYTV